MAVLVPQRGEVLVETLVLVGELGGVALGEETKDDRPSVGHLVDLLLDLPWVAHVIVNATPPMDIPWICQSRGQTKKATTTAAPTTSAATASHVSADELTRSRARRAGPRRGRKSGPARAGR